MYKGLLRQSRPRQDCKTKDAKSSIHLPLTAKSVVMQTFLAQCLNAANTGKFVLISGHPGDLLEGPALFQYLMEKLVLQSPLIAPSGNERIAILGAKKKRVDALYVSCAHQIPLGTQEWMAEGFLRHVSLIMLCYPMHKNLDLSRSICQSLREKCEVILKYPSWDSRSEDHADCITTAVKLAEGQYNRDLDFNERDMQTFLGKPWKSYTHMVAAMMFAAKPEEKTPKPSRAPLSIAPDS
jgi:hypothetical protein